MTTLSQQWEPKARRIPLTKGRVALVSQADYEDLSQWKWHARECGRGRHWYAARKITVGGKMRTVYMHRYLMHPPKGLQIDHINDNGLDNTRSNLRICTSAQNSARMRKRRRGKVRFRGVSHSPPNSFRARIQVSNEEVHIGCFSTAEAAAKAYDKAAIGFFGEYARLNFEEQKK